MKYIPCSNPTCCQRRSHFTIQDTNRKQQQVQVDDDFTGKAFCSLTCAMLEGSLTAKYFQPIEIEGETNENQ